MIFDLLIFFFSIDHANPLLLCLLLSFFLHDHFCSLSINGYTLAPYAHLKMSCRVMRRSKSRISIFKSKNTLIIHVECWWNAQRGKKHTFRIHRSQSTHIIYLNVRICVDRLECVCVCVCACECVCVCCGALPLSSTFNIQQTSTEKYSRFKVKTIASFVWLLVLWNYWIISSRALFISDFNWRIYTG